MATSSENKFSLASWYPLLAGLVVFVALFLLVYTAVLAHVGEYVYPMDDTYIHMAMSKNLINHGTWGTNAHEFASASSSPLWTLLIAGFFACFGFVDSIPLWMNLGVALVLIATTFAILRCAQVPGWLSFCCVVGLGLLTPLIPLVFGGLEHTLHALLCLLFVALVLPFLCKPQGESSSPGGERPAPATQLAALILVALLLPAVRYESLFLLFSACCLLIVRGRWRVATLLATAAAISTTLLGVYFTLNGSAFLPNSVLLKGQSWALNVSTPADVLPRLAALLLDSGLTQHLYVLMCLMAVLLMIDVSSHGFWSRGPLWIALTGMTCMLHILFARTGWFFRYEAYLIVMSLVAGTIAFADVRQQVLACLKTPWLRVAFAVLCIYVLYPLFYRGGLALKQTPIACGNIHDQQVQMARFIKEHFDGQRIALNDIGAVNYYTNATVLDLVGLGTNDVLYLRRRGEFNTAAIRRLVKEQDVKLAMVYDSWFQEDERLPGDWTRVGQWTLRNNYICGDKTVSFYAVRPQAIEPLRLALTDFAHELPKTVLVNIERTTIAQRE